jgi:RNA polymerase sigma-70 factor (family 1)
VLNPYTAYSDSQLIVLLTQRSDEPAFAEIYRRYARELLREAKRKIGSVPVAEDLVQEVFVTLWQKKAKLEIQKSVRSYLRGMLKYHVIDYYADNQKSPVVPASTVPLLPDPQESDYLMGTFLEHHYEEALQKLPQKCREVFELRRKGYSGKDIGFALNISEKTVEAHIGKALRFLRLEMKDYLILLALIAYYLYIA